MAPGVSRSAMGHGEDRGGVGGKRRAVGQGQSPRDSVKEKMEEWRLLVSRGEKSVETG